MASESTGQETPPRRADQGVRGLEAEEDRLRRLVRASREIGELRELDALLRRTVSVACELVGARYGALGVLTADGAELGEIIAVGQPDGPLSVDQHRHRSADGCAAVPVRVGGEQFGNLHVCRDRGQRFSDEERDLLATLAVTAGVAIENARMVEDERLREEWLVASTEITRSLLSSPDPDQLMLIAETVQRLAAADIVSLGLPDQDRNELRVAVAAGPDASLLTEPSYALKGTLSEQVLASGEPVLVDDVAARDAHAVFMATVLPLGPVMVLPLTGSKGLHGTLVVARRRGRRLFTTADLEMATTFANHAAVALELADARRDQQQVLLLQERARIARDLHDHVIQQLFAAGMMLQRAAAGLDDPARSAALNRGIGAVDEAIKQVRTSIYQMQPLSSGLGLRGAILGLGREAIPNLGFEPHIVIEGPLDSVGDGELANDVIAVLREALTNVARHAEASRADVFVHATPTSLSLTISDDGVGVAEASRRSGLRNLEERALRRGGRCTVNDPAPLTGTVIRWTVPLGG